jgi:hypothetical protein
MSDEEIFNYDDQISDLWCFLQAKVFTRWINTIVIKKNICLEDGAILTGALDDGIVLWTLIEVLTGETQLPPYNKNPKFRIQMVSNISTALEYLNQNFNIRFSGITGADIVERNRNLILGLVWTLIVEFKLAVTSTSFKHIPQKEFVDWLNNVGIPTKNLSSEFLFRWKKTFLPT